MSRLESVLALCAAGVGTIFLTAAFAGPAKGPAPLAPELQGPPAPYVTSASAKSPGDAAPHGTPVLADFHAFEREPYTGPSITEADLAPYFLEGALAAAKAHFDAERYSAAAQLLKDEASLEPPARYLRAMALYRAQRPAEAAEAFSRLAPEYAVLADRCYFHAGLAWEDAQRLREAATSYAQVPEESLLHREARRNLARVLRQSGDLAAAIDALMPLASRPAPTWGWDYPGDFLFAVAEMEQARGNREAARTAYLDVWGLHPRSRYDGKALERARALGGKPTVEHRIARAELILEVHRNRDAISILSPISESPPPGLSEEWLCRARFALGKALRKERSHTANIEVQEKVLATCADPEVRVKSLYLAGTSAAIVAPEKAVTFYRQLADEFPDHSFADDALVFASESLARLGRDDEARRALQTATRLYRDGDYRADGLFRLFWMERNAGRLAQALNAIEHLALEYAADEDPDTQVRAMYWRARTLAELGQAEDALAEYEALVREFPATYYGMLARSRLEEQAPERLTRLDTEGGMPLMTPRSFSFRLGRLSDDRHFAAAIELLRAGFSQTARDELMAIRRAPLREARDPDPLRLLVVLLHEAGDVRAAHAVARVELKRDLAGRPDAHSAQLWRIAYPLAFRDFLEQHSASAKVDPDLMQALMREESALDPRAHSWAGAVGLLQLMLPTAREVARDLNLKISVSRQHLFDPNLNIRLGSSYFGKLMRRWNGNIALSIASYNAGGNAVGRWISQRGDRQLDEFVEEIPIAETRNYVKRVLRSYNTYRLLYGEEAQAATLSQKLVATR